MEGYGRRKRLRRIVPRKVWSIDWLTVGFTGWLYGSKYSGIAVEFAMNRKRLTSRSIDWFNIVKRTIDMIALSSVFQHLIILANSQRLSPLPDKRFNGMANSNVMMIITNPNQMMIMIMIRSKYWFVVNQSHSVWWKGKCRPIIWIALWVQDKDFADHSNVDMPDEFSTTGRSMRRYPDGDDTMVEGQPWKTYAWWAGQLLRIKTANSSRRSRSCRVTSHELRHECIFDQNIENFNARAVIWLTRNVHVCSGEPIQK
jgi:hypothetical protein